MIVTKQDLDGIHQAIFDLASINRVKISEVLDVFLKLDLVRESDLDAFLKEVRNQA